MKHRLIVMLCCMVALSSHAQENTNVFFNEIMVVTKNDTSAIDGTNLGTIKFGDKGFKIHCSYVDAMNNLAYQCRQKGGNLIKIISIKHPDAWSSCYRIKANAFKVNDPGRYEKEIQWYASRKLKPADFKGTPVSPYSDNVLGLTQSGFGFRISKTSAFHATNIHIYCRFYCYGSWIREGHTNDPHILKHEQGHFDIAEIYARKLFKALNDENIEIRKMQRANEIYNQLFTEYKSRQEQYDDETEHGNSAKQQQNWFETISRDLADLPEYDAY